MIYKNLNQSKKKRSANYVKDTIIQFLKDKKADNKKTIEDVIKRF
jgi:hypothetical protein